MRALHPATLATLLCGLGVSALLFFILQASEDARYDFEVDRRVQARAAAVTNSFEDAANSMRAVNLLLGAAGTVTDAQFAKFAAPLVAVHPYIQALTVFRFVPGTGRAAYEAGRAGHWPNFAIRERSAQGFVRAGERPLYRPLEMVEPVPTDHEAHGYDI